jgi:hypothetical protein
MGLEPTTPCLQSQIGPSCHLRRQGTAPVEVAVALSVIFRWRPVRTAVNGTVVARPARTTFVGPGRVGPARPHGEARPRRGLPRWQGPPVRGRVGWDSNPLPPALAGGILDMKVRCPAVLQMSRDPLMPAENRWVPMLRGPSADRRVLSCCSRTLFGVMVLRYQGPIARPGGSRSIERQSSPR